MSYRVEIRKKAAKVLYKLPAKDREKLIVKIQALAENPHPRGSKNLIGREGWRIRVGNYRVIYEIDNGKLVILVLDIGHRKDIYR